MMADIEKTQNQKNAETCVYIICVCMKKEKGGCMAMLENTTENNLTIGERMT